MIALVCFQNDGLRHLGFRRSVEFGILSINHSPMHHPRQIWLQSVERLKRLLQVMCFKLAYFRFVHSKSSFMKMGPVGKSYSDSLEFQVLLRFQHLSVIWGSWLGYRPLKSSDIVLSNKRHFLTLKLSQSHVFQAIEKLKKIGQGV